MTHAKQAEMNNTLTAFARNTLAKKVKEWATDEQSDRKRKFHEYINGYDSRFNIFLARYDSFLCDVLRESELFAWMCFGVAKDDTTGLAVHATSFYLTDMKPLDRIKEAVCFNYALASQLEPRRAPENRPIVQLDEYLNCFEKMYDD